MTSWYPGTEHCSTVETPMLDWKPSSTALLDLNRIRGQKPKLNAESLMGSSVFKISVQLFFESTIIPPSFLPVPSASMVETRVASRPIQSCFQCRKRKIKCSKSYPCTPCILRGEGDACREVDRSLLQGTERIEELVDRVQKLENTISVLSRRGSPTDDESPRSTRRRESSSPYSKSPSLSLGRPRSRGFASQAPSLLRVGTSAEESAMILEDFAMGHKANRLRASQDFTSSPLSTPSSMSESLPQTTLPPNHPWSLFASSPQDIVRRIICFLPSQAQIQLLLRFYVQHVDWYAKVIHVPTFMAETNILLAHIHQHRYHLVNVDFLGVLLVVLSLSCHFADSQLCEQLMLDYTTCSDYARNLSLGSQACLHYANFSSSHTLEHLQTIVLMGVYQQNHDESDSHWAMLGSAIKIAQNIGMSRLGTETGTRQYPPEWRSSIRREVARRVWWNLVFEDWAHAMAHQGTYSVHPSQNHTSYPANIDDSDLIEADVVQSKPLNVHTEMSSFLCRLRFIELHRQVIDEVNCGGYDLEYAQEMDSRLGIAIGEIKDYFQVTTDPQKFSRSNQITCMERTLCHIMAQTRLLQLHRPFLFKGCYDDRYISSRNQCVKSAQLILQYLGTNRQAEKLLRWSSPVNCGFAAIVVLFADLCHLHSSGAEPSDSEQRRQEIQEGLQLFRSVGESAPPVTRNAINLIENLLAAESSMSSDVKQRLASNDNITSFEQIVKRLIMNASGGSRSVISTTPRSSFDLGTPSSLTADLSPEQLWQPQSLGINKLSPSLLSVQDLHSFNIGGGQFDEAQFAYSSALLPS
ncbi:hypothetical protein NP233_g1052 [Leucocoprinus birnbaumii]|uniref:Zn(2)-C6 fungal-type domain-containing protein n=1 Tax=Leucocoprinus birnbaumii TaxID=56174 RepID=A0AAD5YZV1_9AGAR|nr:hypothetical protein NP233_g1052 [Leucocoprinus birnbaumii]